jgi:hypothetical protein
MRTTRLFLWTCLCILGGRCLAADKPDILFLLSDDHSYPYLGCYGNKKDAQVERELKEALTEKVVLDWDFLPTPLR